jgi:hypothetical protein
LIEAYLLFFYLQFKDINLEIETLERVGLFAFFCFSILLESKKLIKIIKIVFILWKNVD